MVRHCIMYVLSFPPERGFVLICQCVDIEFAEPEDVPEVTRENCFNSSNLGFEFIFTTSSLRTSDAPRPLLGQSMLSMVPVLLAGLYGFLLV